MKSSKSAKKNYFSYNMEICAFYFFQFWEHFTSSRFSEIMLRIRKRCPHLWKNKSCHLQFCESNNKTSKLKFLKNSKICAFHFFIVSRSFMLFLFWIVACVRKRCPLFLKKSVCRYHAIKIRFFIAFRKSQYECWNFWRLARSE